MIAKSPFMPFGEAKLLSSAKAPPRKKEEFVFSTGKSSVGLILVALSEFGIVSVLAGKDKKELVERVQARFPHVLFREDRDEVKKPMAEVLHHIENPRADFKPLLDIRGTALQQKIWKAVRKIPVGQTSTYSEIAKIAGAPRAVRAVGSTCTNNHFFMIIPCHRVLHKGETATNFRTASKRHQMLIKREAKL